LSKEHKGRGRFTTFNGKHCVSLYLSVIRDFLVESELLTGSSGSDRNAYCFRHTYATFRLMEGIDVYFLAKQMGTSVQMIAKHYGHIFPNSAASASRD
jgi:integrase